MELARGDYVVLPDGRAGRLTRSRGEDRTTVAFADGSTEDVARSTLLPCTNRDLGRAARDALDAACAVKLAPRQRVTVDDVVTTPNGLEATVVERVGRSGVVVELEGGGREQYHESSLRSAGYRSSDR